jgi:hypothetical protein
MIQNKSTTLAERHCIKISTVGRLTGNSLNSETMKREDRDYFVCCCFCTSSFISSMTAPAAPLTGLSVRLYGQLLDHHHPLYQFLDTSRHAILDCDRLLHAIAIATFAGAHTDDMVIQRQTDITNDLREYPPSFVVEHIVPPPGVLEYIWGETTELNNRPCMKLHDDLVSAWLKKDNKFSRLIDKIFRGNY